jgi:hypothetical protein
VPAIAALAMLAVLAVTFDALIDAIARNIVAAVRELPVDLIVFDDDARGQLERSRLAGDVDTALADRGVAPGADLLVDGADLAVSDTAGPVGLGLQGTAWVEPARWRALVTETRPDLAPAPGAWPAITVTLDDGADPTAVADAIEEATPAVEALTVDEAVAAIPGPQQEQGIFTALIAVTVLIAWLVVGLFLALLTIERLPTVAVLRAIGLRRRSLAAGLIAQAVLVAVAALAVAAALAAQSNLTADFAAAWQARTRSSTPQPCHLAAVSTANTRLEQRFDAASVRDMKASATSNLTWRRTPGGAGVHGRAG